MATDTRTERPAALAPLAWRPVLAVAGVLVAAELAFAGGYGYHRDELYFREAGHHLAWGYIDQPTITPLLGRVSTAVFGDTLRGLRVVPAFVVGLVILVGALLARELGGSRRAQVFAAAAVATSGGIVFLGHQLATPLVDVLAWLVIVLLVVRLLRTGETSWWVPIGLAAGVGLENKHLVLLLLAGLLAGLAATHRLGLLRSRWFGIGAGLALVLWLPNLLWQADHGWPQIELGRDIAEEDGTENRALLVPLQFLLLGPLYAVWLMRGWRWLWRDLTVGRVLAVAYLVVLGLLLVTGGKGYYAVGLLVVLLVAGVVATGDRLGRAHVVLIGLSAVLAVLIAFPVLPIETYADTFGQVNDDVLEMWGWDDHFVPAVAAVVDQVPAADRDRVVILTANYGEAGAIDRYGPDLGLPEVYSGHNSYADFRRPTIDDPVPVLVGFDPGAYVDERFTGCEVAATYTEGLDDSEEQGIAIQVCDGIVRPWPELWDDLRHIG